MRLVVAVLKPTQLEAVRQALAAVHVTRLTVCDAHGYDGPVVVPGGAAADGPAAGGLVQEAVMEIAVNEDFLERTVATIAATLAGGASDAAGARPSDADSPQGWPDPLAGRLFVLPIVETVQIYRAVRGPEAL
jgi:nitrogen regulatory protein P-II 1